MIGDGLSGQGKGAALAIDQVVRPDGLVLECRRHQEGLEGGAGLDRVEEGTRAGLGVGHVSKAVRVEAGPLGQCQHVSAGRVEYHHHAAACAGRLHCVGQGAARVGLKGDVQGERDVSTGGGPVLVALTHQQLPGAVSLGCEAARAAA